MDTERESQTQKEEVKTVISSDSVAQAVHNLMLADVEQPVNPPTNAEIKRALWADIEEIDYEAPPPVSCSR